MKAHLLKTVSIAMLLLSAGCSGGGSSSDTPPPPPPPPAVFTPQDQTDVVYGTGLLQSGSKTLLLDVYQSGEVCTDPRPFAVAIHGGSFLFGSKDGFLAGFSDRISEQGVVGVAINYRLIPDNPIPSAEFTPVLDGLLATRPANPSQADINFFNAVASAFEDATNAIRWVRDNAEDLCVDPDRYAVVGNSAGSVISLHIGYALDEFSISLPKPAAVINNWGQFIGGDYMEASDPPLLILHGDSDSVVDYSEALELEAEAQMTGLDFSFYTVIGGGHGFEDIPIDEITLDGETLESIETQFLLDHFNGAPATYETRSVPVAGN